MPKLLDVVSVADVDAEERVDDSLVDILKLRLGGDIGAEYWSRFWSWLLVKILSFGRDFEAGLVKILGLSIDQDFEADFWG